MRIKMNININKNIDLLYRKYDKEEFKMMNRIYINKLNNIDSDFNDYFRKIFYKYLEINNIKISNNKFIMNEFMMNQLSLLLDEDMIDIGIIDLFQSFDSKLISGEEEF